MDILARSKWPSHQLYLSLLCVLPLIHCSHIKDKPDDLRKEKKIEQVDSANIETNVVDNDKPDAIMPYNKDVNARILILKYNSLDREFQIGKLGTRLIDGGLT